MTGSAIVDWAALHAEEILRCLGPVLRCIPSGSTLRRVLRYVDVEVLERLVGEFIRGLDRQDEAEGRVVAADGQPLRGQAVDGKDVRGASSHGERVYLVSLVRHGSGAVLAQAQVEEKAGEGQVVPQLLASRKTLTGTLTTLDALHTNRALAQQIIDQGGDYLLVVKANQPTLLADIETFFQEPPLPREDDRDRHTYMSKAHGRMETRTLTCSEGLNGYLDWPGVKQVAQRRCHQVRGRAREVSEEVTYAITSLDRRRVGARELEAFWRGHWTIENKDHYVRDQTMGEDRCQIHKGNAPRAMAALKNAILARLRYHGWTNMAEALRLYGASVQDAFAFLAADAT